MVCTSCKRFPPTDAYPYATILKVCQENNAIVRSTHHRGREMSLQMSFTGVRGEVGEFFKKNRRDNFRCKHGTRMTRQSCRAMQERMMSAETGSDEKKRLRKMCMHCTVKEEVFSGIY